MAGNLRYTLDVDAHHASAAINEFFSAFQQTAKQASASLQSAFNKPIQQEVELAVKGGKKVKSGIAKQFDKTKGVKGAYKALNGEIAKTPKKLQKQAQILTKLQAKTAKYKQGAKGVSKEWTNVNKRLKKVQAAQGRLGKGGGMGGLVGKFALVQTAANLGTSAIMAMGQAVGNLAQTGVRMEQLMLQLEAFAGGAEEAKAVYEQFANTARKTPFNVEEVANAGKIMMAFGVDTVTAADMTDRLAIAAAATGGDVNNLGRNLGQIAAQGQAYTRDLHQFAMQGLPIWDEMSKVTGKSVVELKKMASEGQIGFDIVSKAIKNMTKEGSAYAKVAEKMQETFGGRLAAIETAFANLALGAIQAFNNMDEALGGSMSGMMLVFANGMEALGKELPKLGKIIGLMFAQLGVWGGMIGGLFDSIVELLAPIVTMAWEIAKNFTFFGIVADKVGQIFGPLAGKINESGVAMAALFGAAMAAAITAIIVILGKLTLAVYGFIKAQVTALGLAGPKGWAILTVGAAAGAAAWLGVKDKVEDANKELEASKKQLEQAKEKAEEAGMGANAFAEGMAKAREQMEAMGDNPMDKVKQSTEDAAAETEMFYDQQIQHLDEQMDKVDSLIEKKKAALEEEKKGHDEIKSKIEERAEAEKAEVSKTYDEKIGAIDREMEALRELTPAENALREIRRAELVDKLKSGNLSQKEALQAQAQLERMARQDRLRTLALRKKKEEAKKAKEMKGIEDRKNTALRRETELHEAKVAAMEKDLNILEASKQGLEDQKSATEEMKANATEFGGAMEEAAGQVAAGADSAKSLADDLGRAATNASKIKIPNAATPKFAGGPVSGGSTYTVNELGKEAFLSASGRLSMINAPAFGQWKAPGAGTVIPAHLTKQLDVPTGGVNINAAASTNASRAGSGGMGAMISAIKSSMGGDTFNQSVTVQSSNPTQTANNMMVEMTRLRRRGRR